MQTSHERESPSPEQKPEMEKESTDPESPSPSDVNVAPDKTAAGDDTPPISPLGLFSLTVGLSVTGFLLSLDSTVLATVRQSPGNSHAFSIPVCPSAAS